MKFVLLSLILLCASGCGRDGERQARRRVIYPALTESPPPPLPSDASSVEKIIPRMPPDTIIGENWMDHQIQKESLIEDLREQAAKKAYDPLALTEEAIEYLSKLEDLAIQ